MKKFNPIFPYFLFSIFYSLLYASGTDPAAFLSFGTGARAFALGGAYSAISDDATATYYNSAALGALQYKELLASYSQLWENTNYSFLAYAHPILDRGAIGINFVRLYSGGAEKRDENNLPVGNRETFDNTKTALNLGYGKELFKNVFFGLNTKIINSTLETLRDPHSIWFTGVDLGSYFRLNHYLTIGTNLQNLIPATFGNTDDRLPLNFKFGLGYKLFGDNLLLAADLNKNSGMSANIIDFYSIGFEYGIKLPIIGLNLRAGKNNRELTAGLGMKYKLFNSDFSLDYALAYHDYLGPSHRASVNFKFGKSLEEIRLAKKIVPVEKKPVIPPEAILAQEQKEEQFKKLYQEAIESYRNGIFKEALEKFKQAKEILPEDTLVPIYIERLETVTEVISQSISPGKVPELLRRGVMYYIEGDGESAVKTIAYALSIEPENLTIERLLNRFEEKTGIKAEKSTPTTNLSVVEQKLYECLIYFRKKDFWKVISLCEDVLVLEPENVIALKRLGSAFFALGDKAKAKEVWEKVLKIQPDKKLEAFLKKIK